MQIIIPPTTIVDKIIGQQKRKEDQFPLRLLTYVIQQHVEDGLLIYNTLTLCLVWLNKEEAQHLMELDELFELWFLVPQDHDDKKLCKQVKSMAMLFEKKNARMDNFVILPTSDCNARCFYCFEKNAAHIHMSIETAKRVAQFIVRQQNNDIHIRWFGGEPLYNVHVIDIICQQLKDSGIKLTSTMVSNGYLFDDNVIQRAKQLWKLKKVQITLDGTEEIYNRSKRYIYKDGNAYQQVLDNIGKLTAAEIKVIIRLNVDKHNIDNMFTLVRELHERFGENSFLTIYSHVLFDYIEGNTKRTQEERNVIYKQRMELEQLIKNYHYKTKPKLPTKFRVNHCMADNDRSVVITPNGYLGKCEHYIDSEFYGHINTEENNLAVINRFKERPKDEIICKDCVYYPQCNRLLICSEDNVCYEDIRRENIRKIEEGMLEQYIVYKDGE